MRGSLIVASLLFGLVASDVALAQGFQIGPGGVRVYEDRRGPPPPPYDDGRGYGRRGGGGGGGQVCAYENGFCEFRGSAIVRYGARGSYVSREARNGIPCNNRVFGDPAPGIPKRCIVEY